MPTNETLRRQEGLIIRALAAPVPQQLLTAPVGVKVDARLLRNTAAVVAIVALVDVFALEVPVNPNTTGTVCVWLTRVCRGCISMGLRISVSAPCCAFGTDGSMQAV